MRLHRFYTSQAIGNNQDIKIDSAELSNQIRKVFRMKTGDKAVLFDGSGFDYEVSISDINDLGISFNVENKKPSRFIPSRKIYLFAAIVKKDNFEWITEKATELGVTDIIPVVAERSEKKSLNMERLAKIVKEASEQSGRGDLPKVLEMMDISTAINFTKEKNIVSIAFHTEASAKDLGGYRNKDLALFIGPEGGWSMQEIEVFHKNNIDTISLGRQILRAETAVISAITLFTLPN